MRRVPLALALALALLVPAAAAAAEPPVEFVNTGERCRNLLVSGPLDPQVAREVVPRRFDIGDEPSGFVELASCEGGTLDGEPLGAFRLAEAAVDIEEPAPVPGSRGTTGGHIYALTQLDTSPRLSVRKKAVGFTSELVDIRLEPTAPLATRLSASIPWPASPYTMTADVTPEGAPVPGVTLVTRIWGQGPRGVVVTHNDIRTIRSGSAGVGVAEFRPGSLLARLFGTTRLQGPSISGVGDFVNTTYVIEPAPAPAAAAPAGRAACRSRRAFDVRLPRAIARGARATVGGRRVAVRRRTGRLVARVDLRGRAAGRVVVRLSGRTRAGRRVAVVRRFRTCA
jgi:hypothetical protein